MDYLDIMRQNQDIGKEEVAKYMPFFFKFLDFDSDRNIVILILFRLMQSVIFTSNMAHPDEYW
jgi:hypothetical protein